MKRMATEGAVIVFSILLAFWIDAWWDDRQARETEATVLASIRDEVEANRAELDLLEERNADQFDRAARFMRMRPEELRTLPQDSVLPWLSAMLITWTYDEEDSAAGLFLGASAPVTDHARSVRGLLARWVGIMEDTQEEKASLWDTGFVLAELLAPHASEAAAEGPDRMQIVAARLGPDLLAALREDEAFVAALLRKAHYQTVYAMELGDASAVLDSLRGVLNRGAGGQ
jgi:hypothetical protein